jgi:hypothetical protein
MLITPRRLAPQEEVLSWLGSRVTALIAEAENLRTGHGLTEDLLNLHYEDQPIMTV